MFEGSSLELLNYRRRQFHIAFSILNVSLGRDSYVALRLHTSLKRNARVVFP